MAEIFQYIVVFSLAVWTARLAITKGRNGWTWGGAALILGLLPWHLIGVIPVLALMFIKPPASSTATQENSTVCARCNKSHLEGQHFCTGCGWDLNQPTVSEALEHEQTPSDQPSIPTAIHSTDVSRVPETAETHSAEPAAQLEQESVAASEYNASEFDTETVPEENQPAHIPWGTYDVGEPPTAAVMVTRGIERISEGKFQEAIDQFTKAIALDPNYAEAWERRSEAYTLLGRPQQAENDLRHWKGLDPSSSPG